MRDLVKLRAKIGFAEELEKETALVVRFHHKAEAFVAIGDLDGQGCNGIAVYSVTLSSITGPPGQLYHETPA